MVVAQSLTQFAQFTMSNMSGPAGDAKLAIVASPAIARSLGRPTVVTEGQSRDGMRITVVWTRSVSAFYSMIYATPASLAKQNEPERDRLFASLRITDPLADRGTTVWWHPPIERDSRSLTQARTKFHTKVPRGRPAGKVFDGTPAPLPPANVFDRVQARGPVGRLWTYITPDPKDHKKHPAVIWAHGGFGGIDKDFWSPAPRSNDQSAGAFRAAGIVLAVGSWRAENDNPGDYELYYGEVDDLLAIAEHVRKLPYVDPERIYLAGHSSGGTLVLLAAERGARRAGRRRFALRPSGAATAVAAGRGVALAAVLLGATCHECGIRTHPADDVA
jgi:alpha/beta superfamily hydrolase